MSGTGHELIRIERWTSPASGGVAVVALRGPGALARLERVGVEWSGASHGLPAGPRLVRLARDGEPLDEGLLVRTGEESFELHLHGSPPLVSRVLEILRESESGVGASPDVTEPGDPAERAWALLDLAPSELGARILLDQAEGAFTRGVQELGGLSHGELVARVSELVDLGRRASFLLRATTIALTGPVNAGKSTLFNLLVGSQRALVSAERGTTRDAIGEPGFLGPWPVVLIDTAGQRDLPEPGSAGDPAIEVERAGQRLARRIQLESDWSPRLDRAGGRDVGDGSEPHPTFWTCCDELGTSREHWPESGISAQLEPEHALETVRTRFEAHFALPSDPAGLWVPGRAVPFEPRQLSVLGEIAETLAGSESGDGVQGVVAPMVASLLD